MNLSERIKKLVTYAEITFKDNFNSSEIKAVAQLIQLAELLAECAEALEFYGNRNNWNIDHDLSGEVTHYTQFTYKDVYEPNVATKIGGAKAKETLSKLTAEIQKLEEE